METEGLVELKIKGDKGHGNSQSFCLKSKIFYSRKVTLVKKSCVSLILEYANYLSFPVNYQKDRHLGFQINQKSLINIERFNNLSPASTKGQHINKSGVYVRLILVRHGETSWNRDRRIQGVTDLELTEEGVLQAHKLARALAGERISLILSSPLKRAYETAKIIASYHGLSVVVNKGLRELDAGDLEGLTYEEFLARHPDFLDRWRKDQANVTLPRGESLREVQKRAWPVIEPLLAQPYNTCVVTHSFVIMAILCKLQNLPLSNASKMRIAVASKTCVDIEDGKIKVVTFSDTKHLAEDSFV